MELQSYAPSKIEEVLIKNTVQCANVAQWPMAMAKTDRAG